MNMKQILSDLHKSLEEKGIKVMSTGNLWDIKIPHDHPPKPRHLWTQNVEQKPVYAHQVVDSPIYSNSRYKGD